jgi:hypothetical protein
LSHYPLRDKGAEKGFIKSVFRVAEYKVNFWVGVLGRLNMQWCILCVGYNESQQRAGSIFSEK